MSKRIAAKHKLDRRMGENIWGRSKSPVNCREMARVSMASAARASCRTSVSSCAPSRS